MARACDDLVGAAAVLATLLALRRSRAQVNVLGVLSRAEEDGFRGALALTASRALPKQALVSLVGDQPGTAAGESDATRFLQEVAGDLRLKRKGFRVQRALMGGGTCEATAYQEFGFQCAVCVALGHYRNCGPRRRIAAES